MGLCKGALRESSGDLLRTCTGSLRATRHGLSSRGRDRPASEAPLKPDRRRAWRLTTRWSRPGQPGRLRICDTRPWLAGRLISRPLGAQGHPGTGIQDMIVTHDLRLATTPPRGLVA